MGQVRPYPAKKRSGERAGQIPQPAQRALERTNPRYSKPTHLVCYREMKPNRWLQPPAPSVKGEWLGNFNSGFYCCLTMPERRKDTHLQYSQALCDKRVNYPKEEVSSKSCWLPAERRPFSRSPWSTPHVGARTAISTKHKVLKRKGKQSPTIALWGAGRQESKLNPLWIMKWSTFVKVLLFKNGFPTLYFTNYIKWSVLLCMNHFNHQLESYQLLQKHLATNRVHKGRWKDSAFSLLK